MADRAVRLAQTAAVAAPTSSLVDRLIAARDDARKQRLHQLLLALHDHRLNTGLGLSDVDVLSLCSGKLLRLETRHVADEFPVAARRSKLQCLGTTALHRWPAMD